MKLQQRERKTAQYVGHKSSIELPKKFAKRLVRVTHNVSATVSVAVSICFCVCVPDL